PESPGWTVKAGYWFAAAALLPAEENSSPAREKRNCRMPKTLRSPAAHVYCRRATHCSSSDQASRASRTSVASPLDERRSMLSTQLAGPSETCVLLAVT